MAKTTDYTEKYKLVPEEFKTAKEIGLAAATLGAMARRGFVEVKDGSPKQYRRSNNPYLKIYSIINQNRDDFDEYFTLRKADEKLGMLCRLINANIVDCYDRIYDLVGVNKIEFNTRSFDI